MTDAPMLAKSPYERRANDAYYTQPRVTQALLDAIKLRGRVWEPASGHQDMVRVLEQAGYHVFATDLADRDTVFGGNFFGFLRAQLGYETIITNPPFSDAERFVRHALHLMEPVGGLVCMLLPSEWDSAASRTTLFTHKPFRAKLVLTFRPRWDWWETDKPLAGADISLGTNLIPKKPKISPRHNFAWYVWDFLHTGPPTIGWLS